MRVIETAALATALSALVACSSDVGQVTGGTSGQGGGATVASSSSSGSIAVGTGAGGASSSCGQIIPCASDKDCEAVGGTCAPQGELGPVCVCNSTDPDPTGPSSVTSSSVAASSVAASSVAASSSSGGGDDFCAMHSGVNIVIYGNYDGGSLDITVDQDIPNLVIAAASYNPMTISISGPFAANVVRVHHAGYVDGSTVSGVDPAIFLNEVSPPLTNDACGAPFLIEDDADPVCEDADDPSSGGVESYFKTKDCASLVFHACQYESYSTRKISDGGSCAGVF